MKFCVQLLRHTVKHHTKLLTLPVFVKDITKYQKRCYMNPIPLRSKKKKSSEKAKDFVDARIVRVSAGNGGDGCISFLSLYRKEFAGPDGGDGGNGGHVIFEAHSTTHGLGHIQTTILGTNGQKGFNKDCHGRNAKHTILQVPVGTVFKDQNGHVICDLSEEHMMFLAARAGAGGRGNHFFASDLDPEPRVAELGAEGENFVYSIELSTMAHFGLLGFPNAGKSTLLQAVTRANPKVASYPFTTLKPHLGVVHFNDMEQLTIADLPGIIEGSHQNKGLGITFLRHAERCYGLLILLDMSLPEPWVTLQILRNEVLCFSTNLSDRPQIVVANKMDCEGSDDNLEELVARCQRDCIIPISAKHGQNLGILLIEMRKIYDRQLKERQKRISSDKNEATDYLA